MSIINQKRNHHYWGNVPMNSNKVRPLEESEFNVLAEKRMERIFVGENTLRSTIAEGVPIKRIFFGLNLSKTYTDHLLPA